MRNTRGVVIGGVGIVFTAFFFLVPFLFILLLASQDRVQSNELRFAWPRHFQLLQNIAEAFSSRDYLMVIAFINSVILTVVSVAAMVLLGAMVAYVWQRRPGRATGAVGLLVLAGLIVPPAIVPTIWVLQKVGLFKTMPGLILVEVAYGLPFCILLFRAFIASVPRELDEAATVDGASPLQIFFRVIFPVLRSVMITVIILQSVFVYNDFQNPLYFLPGHRERDDPDHPAELPEPVHDAVQPAVRDDPAGDDPAVRDVHLLQPQDRRRHGRGVGEGVGGAARRHRSQIPSSGTPSRASVLRNGMVYRSRAAGGLEGRPLPR